MATASVSNTFVASTSALSAEVNENFSDLVSFLNDSAIHKDGSKAMTSNLDLGSNKIVSVATPTASTDAANKAYVDNSTPVSVFTRTTNISASSIADGTVTFETESNDVDGWWASGSTFTVPASGLYSLSLGLTLASGDAGSQISLSITRLGGTLFSISGVTVTDGSTVEIANGNTVYLAGGSTFRVDWNSSGGSNNGGGGGVIGLVRLVIGKI